MLTVAIAAPLAGDAPRRPLAERKFALIDRDNFDEVLARLAPTLDAPALRFACLDDFEPLAVARQIPGLERLLAGEPDEEVAPTRSAPDPRPSGSLLDDIVAQTEDPSAPKDSAFVRSLVADAMQGVKTFRKGDAGAREAAMAALSRRLREVMHAPAFQMLEANWRALYRLVLAADTGPDLKLRVIDATRDEAPEVARRAFGGEEPYDLLVLGHEFGPGDVSVLRGVAGARGKVIAGASARLVGVESWPDWEEARHDPQSGDEYEGWRALRREPGLGTITLVGPRVMARLPYGQGAREAEGLAGFEEGERWPSGKAKALRHDEYLWACGSYLHAEALLDGGGEVGRLPTHTYDDEGETEMKCPAERRLTDKHAAMLHRLGLLGVAHVPRTDRAVFVGASTFGGG